LFEREHGFGGHAHTVEVTDGPDAGLPLDVAFMVLNEQNYPKLCRLLSDIGGIALGPSEMSFSYCCRASGEEYAINYDQALPESSGNARHRPAAAVPSKVLLSLYSEIGRFCTLAARDVANGDLGDQELGAYLDARRFSACLRRQYIIPMGAALWSAPPGRVLSFPAALFLRFMENHGLLSLGGGRCWRHILGGSRTYVQAMVEALARMEMSTKLRAGTAVTAISRHATRSDGTGTVTLQTTNSGPEQFDAVVVATHADQALRLLADPSAEEAALLGSFTYQDNDALLHWDESVMPRGRECWASWNYELESGGEPDAVCITYHLNRLQGHRKAARQYFLTLNRRTPVNHDKVLARLRFSHPLFDAQALKAQRSLAGRGMRNRTCFAGSYLGYGFHEDAFASGLLAAESIARA
jgi:predicted NAD/FAD-binding protein